MSEYSRTPGRGHRTSARERAMQVDRQPSPWPCVAMLAGLLLLCLMAPRYWQNTVVLENPAIGLENEIAFDDLARDQYRANHDAISANPNLVGGQFDFSGISIGRFASGSNTDLLNLCTPQPIEELIATHAAMTQLSAHFGRGGDGFDWPLLMRAAMNAAREASTGPQLTAEVRPNADFASPFEFVG